MSEGAAKGRGEWVAPVMLWTEVLRRRRETEEAGEDHDGEGWRDQNRSVCMFCM